jgi:FSR family fosmidomycin resistance protein-like MFS transporter
MLAVLAASHGVNDLLAGWLLGGDMAEHTLWGRLPWLVVYAALAFAGQMPAAWVIDRSRRLAPWLAGALGLMATVAVMRNYSPGGAIIVSGVASALCHVAGGALAMQLPRGERALGWFSAPGIVGLTLGGWLGHTQGAPAVWITAIPLALLAACIALRGRWPEQPEEAPSPPPAVDAHDGLMLLLLLALTLRSALWDLVQAVDLDNPYALFLIAASAASGKVLGGWMISRYPRVHHVSLVMLAACLLLEFGRWHMAGLCAGIALLQSTIPASIILLRRTFGATPAMAAAYGLGVTVALGGVVVPESTHTSGLGIALAAVATVLFGLSLRKERRLWLAG